MEFKGRDPIRSKTVIDNKIIEQINCFNYLGNLISHENEMDVDKSNNYLKITGIINNVFRPKKTRIILYNTLAFLTLLYGSEKWTIKARDARRITAAQMKYMRITAGYTSTDHRTNGEIAKELNITPVLDKIQDYKRVRIQHVNRMPRNRLPRLINNYTTKGK
jgi:hypothetical protein